MKTPHLKVRRFLFGGRDLKGEMSERLIKSSAEVGVLSAVGSVFSGREDFVAVEEPLEIQISHTRGNVRVVKSVSVTMRTPGNDEELAAGFLFSEGLIRRMEQIEGVCGDAGLSETKIPANTVRVVFRDRESVELGSLERHFYTSSSCGVCGKASLEALQMQRSFTLQTGFPMLDAEIVHTLPATLRKEQRTFEQTGGLHAAALFDTGGNLLLLREDVGRHNAVDKVIGARLLEGQVDFSELLLFVSGRASFELMQKALMAGIPILAAVGAPSSLAVELARGCGATLIGFVRDRRFNVYSGADRLTRTQE